MLKFIYICLGGAVGTGARYLVGLWAEKVLGSGFPYGTLMVNVIGSFFISLVMCLSSDAGSFLAPARLFIVTGLLGGFTTYSASNYETPVLLQSGAFATASANVLITLLACSTSGLLGFLFATRLAAVLG